jgi:short subunit dehydrogenase-like uncharacterized protein
MTVVLYGATGYTGRLIARLAGDYGVAPVLAGRSAHRLALLAAELGFENRAFTLDDPAAVRHGITDARVVLHCAGPFVHTFRAMSDACLDTGAHYLDITGEIDVFEALASRTAEAERAGVMLLPGVGFDVAATDCLAAHVAERVPGAQRLTMGVTSSGPLSRGTAGTAVENQDRGGRIRRNGVLVSVPPGWRTRTIDFGDGRPRSAVTIPWGDVSTAWYSTGIPDIEVYAAMPPRLIRLIRASRYLKPLLKLPPVKALQRRAIRARPEGPDETELVHGMSHVWARAEDAAGNGVTALQQGPNAYLLTAHAALLAVRRVLAGDFTPGFQTPSLAFGEDMVLDVPGVVRRDAVGMDDTADKQADGGRAQEQET